MYAGVKYEDAAELTEGILESNADYIKSLGSLDYLTELFISQIEYLASMIPRAN